MARAFIVRPFNIQAGIDFERVQRELIDPVLTAEGVSGRTTQEIARAGNIRMDMFERLVLADVVIADISIHNANVYYELGIRHALRERTTILIRADASKIPFDLTTDRYLEYDQDNPAASREALADALRQSLAAENADSPVFLLLPWLEPPDAEALQPVPREFNEDVARACREGDRPMLAVLDEEVEDFDWRLPGRRLVGRAQFEVKAWPDARATWESVRKERSEDVEANLKLATVFQRLEEPARSSEVLERVLGRPKLARADRAEALALKASNAKQRWIAEWRGAPAAERASAALRSSFLSEGRQAYDDGFLADQNEWYPGINALALATVTLELIDRAPDAWTEQFEDDAAAERDLERLKRERQGLAAAVARSLDAAEFRGERGVWLDLTRADLAVLTSSRPAFVAKSYRDARARLAEYGGAAEAGFPAEAAARQIRLYLELDVMTENARAALEALGVPEKPPEVPDTPRATVLVFSGHRIDALDRPERRFPAASVPEAARMIAEAVAAEQRRAGGAPVEGMAGGASGGDILFHEACADTGIPSTLLLALPEDDFAEASVADAGPEWMDRYRRLCRRLDPKVLSQTGKLPGWLAGRDGYTIWERNNRWMLHTALSRADTDVTLIVLWDGKGGDGPGGTQDMVKLARSRGVKVIRLETATLV
jgi:hypothetical protein